MSPQRSGALEAFYGLSMAAKYRRTAIIAHELKLQSVSHHLQTEHPGIRCKQTARCGRHADDAHDGGGSCSLRAMPMQQQRLCRQMSAVIRCTRTHELVQLESEAFECASRADCRSVTYAARLRVTCAQNMCCKHLGSVTRGGSRQVRSDPTPSFSPPA